jgi:hypothetical protein
MDHSCKISLAWATAPCNTTKSGQRHPIEDLVEPMIDIFPATRGSIEAHGPFRLLSNSLLGSFEGITILSLFNPLRWLQRGHRLETHNSATDQKAVILPIDVYSPGLKYLARQGGMHEYAAALVSEPLPRHLIAANGVIQ